MSAKAVLRIELSRKLFTLSYTTHSGFQAIRPNQPTLYHEQISLNATCLHSAISIPHWFFWYHHNTAALSLVFQTATERFVRQQTRVPFPQLECD
jgi:hypothetical protein